MHQTPATLAAGSILVCVLSLLIIKARQAPFPPGPRGWPLIGNIFDLPPRGNPLPWLEYKDAYGTSLCFEHALPPCPFRSNLQSYRSWSNDHTIKRFANKRRSS